jgi:hypothetical protein
MTTQILAAALFVMMTMTGCVAVDTMPAPTAVREQPVPLPSFDIAMPAPQAPFDTTPITAVETVGASRAE